MSIYRKISNVGQSVSTTPINNPLTYTNTLGSQFNHGAIGNTICSPYSKSSQVFMSQYCASNGFNEICELSSKDNKLLYTTTKELTAGDLLVYNTAKIKYLSSMLGTCVSRSEQFDPTVASSPMITYWEESNDCIPIYQVDPLTIDEDVVMNKILSKPIIAIDILVNIYKTALRLNKLHELSQTKLYTFFKSQDFQSALSNI